MEAVMVVAVRLPDDLERRLDELAKRTGRPKSFYIRQAIEEHLDELEEAYWADEAVKEWQADGRASRPLADLKAELGL
jgi:RHH-type transcriptional regulator, rel operon repressor / antitoxin RelB